MTRIQGCKLRPGHAVVYGGEVHRISRVEHRQGWAWSVAFDDHGWAIAVGNGLVDVHDD